MIQPWPENKRRTLISTRVFDLKACSRCSPRTAREHEFYVLEAPDWINVIPLTVDNNVILIRQYRHGTREMTVEIPGGMVDPGDRDPAAAARRELLEETGYHAAEIKPIGQISPNPAILSNRCHSFLATGLEYRGSPELDSAEDIEVFEAPLAEIPAMIRDGQIDHALVVVAFCHYLRLGL